MKSINKTKQRSYFSSFHHQQQQVVHHHQLLLLLLIEQSKDTLTHNKHTITLNERKEMIY